MDDKTGAPAPLSRKAAQRERDRSLGVKRVELRLPPDLATKLEQACEIRGGNLGPYEVQEYIQTLIEMDTDKLALQLDQLKDAPCEYCGEPLPGGCGGSFKGEGRCAITREEKQLLLREPLMFRTKDHNHE
ncbi:hypothetical protein [Aeromonas phage 59.1]|nr:hypothetical protein [Aeromonas phage 59.1]